ncbi:elongation factor Ts, mitochondrial [Nephila pilipes]|uniref:Elongation factor Ts, mitochondrial n=1 Tax=Nephila pilipes TaxID=299642 RepID=A0A8X6QAS8_NEPPI|nr:elongation factor Ts, mitochondrial [Nephila pilipes]GFU15353.1 elongation factor Ts, mitochondrial [Nephila pilipes]
MLGVIGRRFFHSGKVHLTSSRSSALGKLRKSTGYSVSNCKKALDLFPDDISKAEEWLHGEAKQQGWSKWAKIQARSATQGVIGVFSKDKIGVMVEVNCETDFVARNAEFQQFVGNVLSGCVNHINTSCTVEDIAKTFLNESQLNDIKHDTTTISELVNAAVSKFNEKTVVKRAVCFKVKDDLRLSSVVHPNNSCPNLQGGSLGKYGVLLVYKNNDATHDNIDLSLDVCQHIIGMNPSSIGQLTEQDVRNFNKTANSEETDIEKGVKKTDSSEITSPENLAADVDQETEGQDTLSTNLKETEETKLLFQPFLLDSSVTVGEIVFKNGLEVVDFERFECGENCIDNMEVKEVSSAGM